MDRDRVISKIVEKHLKFFNDQKLSLGYWQNLEKEDDYTLGLIYGLWYNNDQVAVIKEKCTCGAKYDRDFPNRHYSYCKGDK